MASCDYLEINGNYLEGGGQIVRNALSFSCILRRPIRITNIRANRPNPGLSNQHLYGLNLLAEVTNAEVKGNYLKSTQVEFRPSNIKAGKYFVDTRTAASISLVLQSALPVLAFANGSSELEVIGGTNVGMAPQVDFMTEVLRPNLEQFGVSFDFDLMTRGYYPRGGGHCKVTIPSIDQMTAVNLTKFGELKDIEGWCYVAGRLPANLAETMKTYAAKELLPYAKKCHIEAYKEAPDMARDNGAGLVLKATTTTNCVLGSSSLGEKQVYAETLGTTAGQQLAQLINRRVCIDEHVQDQLILYMALARGESQILTSALTNHTRTAIFVAEQMTGAKFTEQSEGGDLVLLTCKGIGFVRK